jgi:hypothetical protein
MLLNGQRLFYFVALIATFSLVGCVDTPSSGPTPPNYRSSVKFFHAGKSVDTIAYPISKIVYSRKDSTTSTVHLSGTDSVRTKILYVQSISINRYRRYRVDYALPYDVYVDGALKTTMNRGTSSAYFDVPSGNRLFTIKGNGVSVDSVTITKIDTAVTTYRDSIKGNTVTARLVMDTTRGGTNVKTIVVPSATSKITIDSTYTAIATERQYSMYLIGREKALEQNEGGIARYGKVQFLSTAERMLYQSVGFSDTLALVKFVHAYTDTGSYSIRKSPAGTDEFTGLTAGTVRGIFDYFTPGNSGTRTYYIRFGSVNVDSVSINITEAKTYSVVIRSEAGARKTEAYTH